MVEIEILSEVIEELADLLGIFGGERSFFTADLEVRIREAILNEQRLRSARINQAHYPGE